MTRKKGLRAFSKQELLEELARRHADELYRDGMTMTDRSWQSKSSRERAAIRGSGRCSDG